MASPFHGGFPFRKSAPTAQPVTAAPTAATPAPATPIAAAASTSASLKLPQRERRRAPRQTLVAKAAIRPDTPIITASLISTGFVSNISMNGIGFHTRKPLAIGEKYRINLEVGPMKWSSRMRIVSCQSHPKSNTFDVGAEFVGNDLIRERVLAA